MFVNGLVNPGIFANIHGVFKIDSNVAYCKNFACSQAKIERESKMVRIVWNYVCYGIRHNSNHNVEIKRGVRLCKYTI